MHLVGSIIRNINIYCAETAGIFLKMFTKVVDTGTGILWILKDVITGCKIV